MILHGFSSCWKHEPVIVGNANQSLSKLIKLSDMTGTSYFIQNENCRSIFALTINQGLENIGL